MGPCDAIATATAIGVLDCGCAEKLIHSKARKFPCNRLPNLGPCTWPPHPSQILTELPCFPPPRLLPGVPFDKSAQGLCYCMLCYFMPIVFSSDLDVLTTLVTSTPPMRLFVLFPTPAFLHAPSDTLPFYPPASTHPPMQQVCHCRAGVQQSTQRYLPTLRTCAAADEKRLPEQPEDRLKADHLNSIGEVWECVRNIHWL